MGSVQFTPHRRRDCTSRSVTVRFFFFDLLSLVCGKNNNVNRSGWCVWFYFLCLCLPRKINFADFRTKRKCYYHQSDCGLECLRNNLCGGVKCLSLFRGLVWLFSPLRWCFRRASGRIDWIFVSSPLDWNFGTSCTIRD